ncbi:MAG: hypothetical protein EHM93_05600 [Bacteroidales bacterium]|nr:MAG: hypothetical protein EHM93_05600 [Bacteroidales bacterium]
MSEKKCGECGILTSGQPSPLDTLNRIRSGNAGSAAAGLAGAGYYCPSCNKGFCGKCAREAARKYQKGGYTCPKCGALIGDNPW